VQDPGRVAVIASCAACTTFVNRYIALSQHLADYLQYQVRVPDEIISQVYNGSTPTDSIRVTTQQLRAAFQAPDHWLIGSGAA
jgi:hypothetical protein